MKKRIMIAAAMYFVAAIAFGQVGNLLKKAKEKVQNKVEDKAGAAKQPAPSGNAGNRPEPDNATVADATLSYMPMPDVMAEKLTDLPAQAFLVYNEVKVDISADGEEIVLVAKNKDTGFQVFRDGKWSEPMKNFDRNTAAKYGVSVGGGSSVRNLYRFAQKISPDNASSLIQKRRKMMNGIPIAEEHVIVHNGKTYGPYMMIQEVMLSNDGKHFFALVMPEYTDDGNMWKNYRLIGDQLAKPLPIIPPDRKSESMSFDLMAAGDGKSAVVIVSDFADYNHVKNEILLSDGRRFQMENLKGTPNINESNSFFSTDGQFFCYLDEGKQLFVNGKMTRDFTDYQQLSEVLMNEKGEMLFKVSYRGLTFGDGTVAPVAMHINTYIENGKMAVSWLAPYKDGSIYLCKKIL